MTARKVRWFLSGLLLAIVAGTGAVATLPPNDSATGITVAEKLMALGNERATLQARADGSARIRLLDGLRVSSLLTDALTARHDTDGDRMLEALPAVRQRAFADLDALNATLREAMVRPGEGARLAVENAALRAQGVLARLPDTGEDGPVVLSVTPRFVPPRRGTGELTLAPRPPASPEGGGLKVDRSSGAAGEHTLPTVPRYAPDFAAGASDDQPLRIEIIGLRLTQANGPRPVLAIGGWRGAAEVSPERLFFSVPRAAFATDVLRTNLVNATLSIRRNGRVYGFQLAFVVLPDRPGSFALDQKVRGTVLETNTLVSPEILARAGVGESRTTRRCFDPPEGWRFDKSARRIVIVERLGWVDDIADPTMNSGTAEFAADEAPDQICFLASARPATKQARTATIARFEVTLLRDVPTERAVRTGVRALDWREAARVPLEQGQVEQRLYIRLFDEIDHEFTSLPKEPLPFMKIVEDKEQKILVLQGDASLSP